ncbi:hypothetical protein ACP70R_007725 [Stipagrostis hirtigluma subsp. patula]
MSSSTVTPSTWLRDAWRNFTSIRARPVTGSHLLRIDGYSVADRMVVPGKSIDSPAFHAGGHKWKLSYYPNGRDDEHKPKPGLVSVGLTLLEPGGAGGDPTAMYRVSILDHDGKPAYSYAVAPQQFSKKKATSHVDVLVTAEEREAARRLIGDDSLAVRCDVTVMRFDEESRLKWYLRRLLD